MPLRLLVTDSVEGEDRGESESESESDLSLAQV